MTALIFNKDVWNDAGAYSSRINQELLIRFLTVIMLENNKFVVACILYFACRIDTMQDYCVIVICIKL